MARTRKPRHLLKGAEAPLDGAAALLKRAADRFTVAAAYAGDGDSTTAYARFFDGVRFAELAMKEVEEIARDHVTGETP